MREIKFRAWDRNERDRYRMKNNLSLNSSYFSQETLEGIIIMQYTGLKDKNGVEIYEGDVVKRICLDKNCPLEHMGAVVYSESWGMWGIDDKSCPREEVGNYYAPLAYGNPSERRVLGLEILGNIYEIN